MPKDYFSKDHEWIRVDGDVGTVGITAYAAGQLGDVVFVEVPKVGAKLEQKDVAAVVESVKAAGEVYAPVTGEVVAANDELGANPAWINEEPTGKAWLFRMKIADAGQLAGLMDAAAYDAFVKTLA